MDPRLPDELSPLARAACAYANASNRPVFAAALALDDHLSGVLARVREPMLAQMRLAWWRDQLALPRDRRPAGNVVLDAIGACWAGEEATLIALVDGWEALVALPDEPEGRAAALSAFADGRAALFAAIARRVGEVEHAEAAAAHGRRYAAGEALVRFGEGTEAPPRLPRLARALRPLAILSDMASRAIARGHGPLFGDRASPLALIKLGISGR